MRRLFMIAATAFLATVAVSHAASAEPGQYPPAPTTTIAPVVPTVAPITLPDAPLPATGSDSSNILVAGGIVVVAGAGLILVARSRRRSSDSTT